MRIFELLRGIPYRVLSGSDAVCVDHLTDFSKECGPGSLFFAIKGERVDGHNFVEGALKRGAVGAVVSRPVDVQGNLFLVDDTRCAAVYALRRFYRDADSALFKVGITGTNGKTTVSYFVFQMWQRMGFRSLLVGTVEYVLGDERRRADNTTPGLFRLWGLIHEAILKGCDRMVMEVSSHGLKQKRLGDIAFDAAVFTNLSRDHLDYHKDMEDYFAAKRLLFERHLTGFAVINVDDPWGKRLLYVPSNKVTYGIKENASIRGRIVSLSSEGMEIELDGRRIFTRIIGRHNLYNILAAYALFKETGYGEIFLDAVSDLSLPPGRLERFEKDGRVVFVDYAHTPDALAGVLMELRKVTAGRLIVVFGCGGNRDRGKREEMGRVATELAHLAVITSDNPRDEDPQAIIEDILKGVAGNSYRVIVDRKEAIKWAISVAKPGDIVLVAGKGHENYQIVRGIRYPFDDREVVRSALGGE